MTLKRPFVVENHDDVAVKHQRQLTNYEAFDGCNEMDFDAAVHFLWMTSHNHEFCSMPLFSDYFDDAHELRPLECAEELRPADSYSRKIVPVGPQHQADVPDWDSPCLNTSSRYGGKLVISFDENVSPQHYYSEDSRSICSCSNANSIGCVRRHVTESRDKLRESLGERAFKELGFDDMGETVANKWLPNEEAAFKEIVFGNSSSSGRNFWNFLLLEFPFRSRKGLASYYFNVFMLQQRAEQNRHDPFHIDSDDDEWQKKDVDHKSSSRGMVEVEDDNCVRVVNRNLHCRCSYYS